MPDKKRRYHASERNHHREDSGRFGLGQTLSNLRDPQSTSASPTSAGFRHDRSSNAMADDDGWQTVDHHSSRRKKRKISEDKNSYPELVFQQHITSSLRVKDLQELVLYTLADGTAPTWLAVKNVRGISKVVVMMVPGLEKQMLESFRQESKQSEVTRQRNGTSHHDGHAQADGNDSTTAESGSKADIGKYQKPPPPKKGDWQSRKGLFDHILPLKAPGDSKYARIHSPLQAMLITPTADPKDKKSQRSADEKAFKSERTPIAEFVHSVDELREAGYPIHPAAFTAGADAQLEKGRREEAGQSLSLGWVDTQVESPQLNIDLSSIDHVTQNLTIYALDCEMVLTSDDVYSLARISLVDWSGKIVLDKYVKPVLPVKNYFTQFSGITPQLLENVTTTLSDIQTELLTLFTPSTILLGHSLESDLNAMKITHPFIIDTSMIYPHPRGLPLRSSLKFLANKYLKREIQAGGANGHDSVEDARAVLDLIKLKCEKGPKWGTTEQNGEPIFKRLNRIQKKSAIIEYGTPERGFGKEATHAIGCQSDEEIVKGIIRAVNGDEDGKEIPAGGVDFVWGRLRELEWARGWNVQGNSAESKFDKTLLNGGNVLSNTPKAKTAPTVEATNDTTEPDGSNQPAPSAPSTSNPDFQETLSRTFQHVQDIYASLPPTTLLIIYSGNGDMREVQELQAMQQQYKKEFKIKKWDELTVKWTDTEEQRLRRAVDEARKAVGLVCIK